MPEAYMYDAFISYRHLPLDETIAERVQRLLEHYRPPRTPKIKKGAKIRQLFRDKTELPTSGDLGSSLTEALLSSRYLIVILSEETQNSKWCMEEIRAFKEAHGGSISRILPVLVSGEPDQVIPDILRYEMRQGPDGTPVRVEIEPLCCDVRSDSIRHSCARLKTEFLRLAAPILGCGYDDLYRRHHRRSAMIRLAAAGAMTSVLAVISVFAYSSYVSQMRYERNLVDTYTRQGAEELAQGNIQEAMMYYTSALGLDPSDQAAKTGALLLLQQSNWLQLTGQENGLLVSGRPYYGDEAGVCALNEDGTKTLLSGVSGVYLGDQTGTIQERLSEERQFLSSADDGSCWSFTDDESICFYFPGDGTTLTVPMPTKINPHCDARSVDYFSDAPPNAMAISRERAAVRYGGYLYLYTFTESGEAELFCEFDLENVFPHSANGNLGFLNETWFDAGGSLAALYDGSHVALFNIAHEKNPCVISVYTQYAAGLNDVAFSEDGTRIALVYGNEYGIDGLDPGGFLEVYDQNGVLCMSTEFDPAVALSGAAFEPGGTRIIAWGSSTLHVWDYTTGEPAAAPVRMESLSSAAWGEDGTIWVDDGRGTLSAYAPVAFTPLNGAPGDTPGAESASAAAYRAELNSGLILVRTATDVTLENQAGDCLDEAEFDENELNDFFFINRMHLDAGSSVGYFWYNGHPDIYRVFVDEENGCIRSSQVLDARGWPIVGVSACAGGAIAVTGNGYLFYYTPESTSPELTLQLGRSGIVKSIAADDSGLLAIILRSTDFADPSSRISFEYRYSMELWDLNMGVRLGDLEDGDAKLANPAFTSDGWLIYQRDGETVARLLDAREPDPDDVAYLSGICCYRLNDEQSAEIQAVFSELPEGGIWNECLTAAHVPASSAEAPTGETQTLAGELALLLETQGAEAWLARYDEFWAASAESDLTAAQLKPLFSDYFNTACREDLEDRLHSGFECVVGKLKECAPDDITHLSYTILFTQFCSVTDAYDDILIDYWLFSANQQDELLTEDSSMLDLPFIQAYENRLYAHLLRGEGAEAFFSAIDESYHDQLAVFLSEAGLDVMFYLVSDLPENAVASIQERLEAYAALYSDPEEAQSETDTSVKLLLLDINLFCQHGIISESTMNAVIDSIAPKTGLQLSHVSFRNLEDGLRLGDTVIAVNGVRIAGAWHINSLMDQHPTAELTVLRGNETFVTDPIENWRISGTHVIR